MKFAYVAAVLLPALALAAPRQQTNNRKAGLAAAIAAAKARKAGKAGTGTASGAKASASSFANYNQGSDITDAAPGGLIKFDVNTPPNPQTDFDPATNPGDLGPFVAVRVASPDATGGPASVSADQAALIDAAASSWRADTTVVSNFLNVGGVAEQGDEFNAAAHSAFVAEVNELTHKAILDKVIGLDPSVSVANLTLTNGVFQSVVNNLQIMSAQGKSTVNLINEINKVRCTQILPSIDTYLLITNQVIGGDNQLKASGKPDACVAILAAAGNDASQFPNVPNTPGFDAASQTAAGAVDNSGADAAAGADAADVADATDAADVADAADAADVADATDVADAADATDAAVAEATAAAAPPAPPAKAAKSAAPVAAKKSHQRQRRGVSRI